MKRRHNNLEKVGKTYNLTATLMIKQILINSTFSDSTRLKISFSPLAKNKTLKLGYYYQEMHIFSVQNAFTQNLDFSYFYPMFTVQWLSQIQFGLQILDQCWMYYVWMYFDAIISISTLCSQCMICYFSYIYSQGKGGLRPPFF